MVVDPLEKFAQRQIDTAQDVPLASKWPFATSSTSQMLTPPPGAMVRRFFNTALTNDEPYLRGPMISVWLTTTAGSHSFTIASTRSSLPRLPLAYSMQPVTVERKGFIRAPLFGKRPGE
jgi:hypothetical protein